MVRPTERLHGSIACELGVAIVSGRIEPGEMLDNTLVADAFLCPRCEAARAFVDSAAPLHLSEYMLFSGHRAPRGGSKTRARSKNGVNEKKKGEMGKSHQALGRYPRGDARS